MDQKHPCSCWLLRHAAPVQAEHLTSTSCDPASAAISCVPLANVSAIQSLGAPPFLLPTPLTSSRLLSRWPAWSLPGITTASVLPVSFKFVSNCFSNDCKWQIVNHPVSVPTNQWKKLLTAKVRRIKVGLDMSILNESHSTWQWLKLWPLLLPADWVNELNRFRRSSPCSAGPASVLPGKYLKIHYVSAGGCI